MKENSNLQEDRTEKQIVSLLTSLLTAHEPVTVLGLSTYPEVMSLLKPEAQKVRARVKLCSRFSSLKVRFKLSISHCSSPPVYISM